MAKRLCNIEECPNKHYAKGYCSKHYDRLKKHGDPLFIRDKKEAVSGTPTYYSWANMRSRCLSKKNKKYNNYGGRGIKVCDRWLNSYENFYKDMGEKPKGKTLDRINNDGDYEPKNCRWATRKKQAENRGIQSNNKTGCAGVVTFKNKFRSIINNKGKQYHLSCHDTFEEAVIARLKGELKYWGYIKQKQFKHLLE